MTNYLAKITQWLAYFIAFLVILAATMVSIGHLLTPYLNDRKTDFEKWASEVLTRPVTIKKVSVSWNVYLPQLTFNDVIILDELSKKPAFEIQHIKVNVNIWDSLTQWKPVLSYINITGVSLTIHGTAQLGEMDLAGLGHFSITDNLTGASKESNEIVSWLFSQPALVLDDIEITYVPKKGEPKYGTLYNLGLYNTKEKHGLKGRAILKQDISTTVSFGLDWQGKTLDPEAISAQLYLYLEGISFPQWLRQSTWHGLQIKEGLGSAKIWAKWKHGTVQMVQTQFQLYALELFSQRTHQSQIMTRLNGHVGWKRDKDQYIISGNDILIDLPKHLWPMLHFYASFPAHQNSYVDIVDASKKIDLFDEPLSIFSMEHQIASSEMMIALPTKKIGQLNEALYAALTKHQYDETLQFRSSYVDLDDTYSFILKSGLLSDNHQKILTTLKPKGELFGFNMDVHDRALEKSVFDAVFHHLTIQSFNDYPGVQNLTGNMSWSHEKGRLKLDSKNLSFSFPTLFNHPLSFDQLTTEIMAKKDKEDQWLLELTDLKAKNPELAFNLKAKTTLEDGIITKMDLLGNFSVNDAKYLSRYIPQKKADPDLVRWLNQAFHQGEFHSGEVIVKGDMQYFPFAKGEGKFRVSALAKDVFFNYGPEWPPIKNANGRIVFEGQTMNVDIDHGMLLNFPLQAIHGTIPYIGPHHPQVLNVKGNILADLSQGLQFIHESPLQKTIGKGLNGIKLTGPMQLSLDLAIPVKRPENTEVKGQLGVTQASVMTDWGVSLDALTGMIHFTEKGMEAKALEATLWNEPAHVMIHTEYPKNQSSIMTLGLQSQISSTKLASLISDTPFANRVRGSTLFEAELSIHSSNQAAPIQLVLSSDLKGIALDLPDGLGKKENAILNAKSIVNMIEDKPLELKMQFGKLWSAAFKLNTTPFSLVNGELVIGSDDANWQTEPGFQIRGQFDTFDLSVWKTFFDDMGSKIEKTENKKLSQETSSLPSADVIRRIDIRANQVAGVPLKITRARVQLSPSKTNWAIQISSAEMAGQVIWPKQDSAAIQAKFQYLYLIPLDASSGESLNPKTLPPLSFSSNEVQYNGKHLGRVTFDLLRMSNGLSIRGLRLDSPLYNLNVDGEWVSMNPKTQTRLKGSLSTKNVAKFLTYWGSPTVNPADSGGRATFNLTWPDAPYKPMLSGMSGDATLDISPGRIINLDQSTNAKMGFGRMLNILSIESLSRRLTLNFSDLTEKGYSFNSMKGQFNLKNGNAYTNNTRVDGSIARIDLSGRIGLSAKNYDLTVRITPFVTGSIPVVAAIAVNPLIGVAAWAVEKVATSAMSGATTYRYSITGTWDKPVWKSE